ncbi:hypothetical protein TEA_000111 [Camellia sinensis var. sinensis]|uniref:Glycosyltransferase n=1 Tax=Camellia sinensis var. sinensis TaxID=542762 RepID=A0A4S4EYT3_CAMSN|nr:hypothetical protein TEA_000111 [Camellia sinensis var. sinensis]
MLKLHLIGQPSKLDYKRLFINKTKEKATHINLSIHYKLNGHGFPNSKASLHFVPFNGPCHMIPMIDRARLLAQQGVIVTIVTTPLSANRFTTVIAQAQQSGLQIKFLQLRFPCLEAGLPEGCEILDKVPSSDMAQKFYVATNQYVTTTIGTTVWLVFHGTCRFSLFLSHNIRTHMVFDEYKVLEESEYFVVPCLPDRIKLTKAQLPEYVKEYQKAKGNKVWCIGPVWLCNEDRLDKAERGNEPAIDARHCLNWHDSQQPRTVVYVCLGSLSRQALSQMIEIGLGLEASKEAFIWVIRDEVEELEKWNLEDGFEERTKDRGLSIRGWALQVLILSHRAIGGFVTHCGWNSTLEGICAGVPMTTWPIFGEQFCNEKLIVQVLRIGVSVGVEVPTRWGEKEKVGVLVHKDNVVKAIDKLMDGGEEGEERRKRARQPGEMTKRAMEEGGSSLLHMAMLIQDIMKRQLLGNERERERERESTIVEYMKFSEHWKQSSSLRWTSTIPVRGFSGSHNRRRLWERAKEFNEEKHRYDTQGAQTSEHRA